MPPSCVSTNARFVLTIASRGPSAIAELLVNFGGPVHISGVAEATAVKFCTQVGYIKSYQKNKKNHPQKVRGYGHMTYLTF